MPIITGSKRLTNSLSTGGLPGSIWHQNYYQLANNPPGAGSTKYLHIARAATADQRICGTVEIFNWGELGGTNSGNGCNYYKALWMSFNYIGGGAFNSVVSNNIEAGGNTGTGITGVVATTSSSEIIYTISNEWYGDIAVLISWGASGPATAAANSSLQVAINTTSTAVF